MMASAEPVNHEEVWLSLPWLANGRLPQAEREKLEPHVQTCAACREELALQRRFCSALTEPDRVTYAPGPSFRKLMDRIDGTTLPVRTTLPRRPESRVPLWRPPGLAWAASFVLAIGLTGALTSVYKSSQPMYETRTDSSRGTLNVLHIAFDRSVTVGEAEEALRSTGARIVEGPDNGIFGITPSAVATGEVIPEHASREMHLLSARLRADPRVRWVEPIPNDGTPGETSVPLSRGP
jgi:Putative zinc-finger